MVIGYTEHNSCPNSQVTEERDQGLNLVWPTIPTVVNNTITHSQFWI